jgi:cytochrome c oxidase subunit 1
MNQIASVGAMIIGVSMAIFLVNMIYSSAKGKLADIHDPFGLGGKYYFPFEARNPHH